MEFTSYTVEAVKDPFGILSGKRYEFIIDFEVSEEDEIYSDKGIYIRVVYSVGETGDRIIKHELYERTSEQLLDFELEDEELQEVEAFCREHYAEGDE